MNYYSNSYNSVMTDEQLVSALAAEFFGSDSLEMSPSDSGGVVKSGTIIGEAGFL